MPPTPLRDITSYALLDRRLQVEELQQSIGLAVSCNANVLISDGTRRAREALARRIHQKSARRERPFMVVDFQGTSSWRLDSPFLGSLFIEDAHDLSASMQARVWGILEQDAWSPVAARVIVGATGDLFDRVRSGIFSSGLFYRLNVIHLVIPPDIGDPEPGGHAEADA
jgi:DNA-binding NtrC family response regulator